MSRLHREVNRIREKMGTDPWPKYLSSVQIQNLHGWNGQTVRFPFPVTVIAGENGSGKSTILKAAAAAYSNLITGYTTFAIGTFFPDTPWETITNAIISYEIREGSQTRNFSIRKPTTRWRLPRSGRPKRAVIWQDVSRTLPLDSTVGYSKIAKKAANEVSADSLTDAFHNYFRTVLGRTYEESGFSVADVDRSKSVGVVRFEGVRYSQFHQGAGEDSTLDLMLVLQNIPDTALVIIDEIEASLHPRAQRRLVHFLLWLARTKQIQVIISTHSKYIMDELPAEARVFLSRILDGVEVIYGISSNYALDRMDDVAAPDMYAFCEDEESCCLAKEILRKSGIELSRIRLMGVGPYDVVKALGKFGNEHRMQIPSISVIDADMEDSAGCVRLPGEHAPEKQIFQDIRNQVVPLLVSRIGNIDEGSATIYLDQVLAIEDHHDYPKEFGRRINRSPEYVWETMCQIWVEGCIDIDVINNFARPFSEILM